MSVPILSSAVSRPHVALAQGPIQPWSTEEEAEEYRLDPRAFLLRKTEFYRQSVEVTINRVICATFYLPAYEILPGGQRWHRTDQTLEEVRYQGKVGMVIAKGPLAFVDDPERGLYFKGFNAELGD